MRSKLSSSNHRSTMSMQLWMWMIFILLPLWITLSSARLDSAKRELACKNCGSACRSFSAPEGTLRAVWPHANEADCEWILAPALNEKEYMVSFTVDISTLENDENKDFLRVYKCDQPTCAARQHMLESGEFFGTHEGLNVTVEARALLLRLSSGHNKISAGGFVLHWATSFRRRVHHSSASVDLQNEAHNVRTDGAITSNRRSVRRMGVMWRSMMLKTYHAILLFFF
jgi:hypothetical protein